MKRGTGFKRPAYQRAPRRPLVLASAPSTAVMRRADDGREPVLKRVYVRSPALLIACRTLNCQWCGVADGTVVAAHSNWAVHGKGRGIKADDNRVAALCGVCHHKIDQGKDLTEDQRRRGWWIAHRSTVHILVVECLWPADVPVPPVLEYPKEWS